MTELTAARLKEVLSYDPVTGHFTWKPRRDLPRRLIGQRAGTVATRGYRQICVDGTAFLEQRLAWLYVTEEWPKDVIDHINRNTGDNRFANLRDCSLAENCWNTEPRENTSGVTGASWDANANAWRAQISIDGKVKYLGLFPTADAAGTAYAAAAVKHRSGAPLAR
jgi:hypothetical protein